MTTGEKISALRRAQGMSQEALAGELDISRQAVSKWEADQAVPSRDKLVELAGLFQVSIDALLRPDEPQTGLGESQTVSVESPKQAGVLLSERMYWCVIAWLALLTLGLIACFCWLGYEHVRINALPMGQMIVAAPEAESGSGTSSAIAEYQIDRALVPDASNPADDRLQLAICAVPHTHEESETAQVIVRGSERWLADAQWQDGQYTASITVPLEDTLEISLAVTREGLTTTIPLETLADVRLAYEVALEAEFSGTMSKIARGWDAKGTLFIMEQRAAPWQAEHDGVYFTRGTATLYENGESVERIPFEFPFPEDGALKRSKEITLKRILKDQDAYVSIEVEDNCGRRYTAQADFQYVMQ